MSNLNETAENLSQRAFPQSIAIGSAMVYGNGLTKREYFAGLAMQGICASPFQPEASGASAMQQDAANAVKMADALLAELERTK